MTKVDKKITGYAVKSDKEVAVIVPPKQDREEVLTGCTYKIKPTGLDAAVYITINDLNNRPFEIFVQCKNTESFQYIQTITRLISAIWRNNNSNNDYVYEELKQIFDPKGGYFLPKGGGFVNGVIHHIGLVIEKHCRELPTP
jgi:hypothetical protein